MAIVHLMLIYTAGYTVYPGCFDLLCMVRGTSYGHREISLFTTQEGNVSIMEGQPEKSSIVKYSLCDGRPVTLNQSSTRILVAINMLCNMHVV